MGVVAGDAARARAAISSSVHRRGGHDQRREQLLQHVAVAAQQQPAELGQVVGDQVHLDAVARTQVRSRVSGPVRRPTTSVKRQQVHAAQVDVGVGRGEAVQVRAADRGEDQRVRLLGGDLGQPGGRSTVTGTASLRGSCRYSRRAARSGSAGRTRRAVARPARPARPRQRATSSQDSSPRRDGEQPVAVGAHRPGARRGGPGAGRPAAAGSCAWPASTSGRCAGSQAAELGVGVAGEGLVRPAGTGTRPRMASNSLARRGDCSTSGDHRHSRTVGLASRASPQNRSTSQENCSGSGPSTWVGGLSSRQNSRVGVTKTPRRSTSDSSVSRP